MVRCELQPPTGAKLSSQLLFVHRALTLTDTEADAEADAKATGTDAEADAEATGTDAEADAKANATATNPGALTAWAMVLQAQLPTPAAAEMR